MSVFVLFFQAIQTCVGAAGFSVGEFAALVFAGVMSFADGMLCLYWFLLFNTDSMFIHTPCKCTVFFIFLNFFLVDYNLHFIDTNYTLQCYTAQKAVQKNKW